VRRSELGFIVKRAFVFIDYDMLIRHFILSGIFRELEKQYEVTYVFHTDPKSDKTGIHIDINTLQLKRVVHFEIPRSRMGAWDKVHCIKSLHDQRGTKNYAYRRRLMRALRSPRLVMLYEFLSLPYIYPIIRRKLLKDMGAYEPLRKFLSDEKPDIVIHPSILAGYFINELSQICPTLGIPLVVLMNSWDNPSAKSMNAGLPDRLIVWGPQTRQHAIEYMKMPPERVLEFGAAQFDIYREPIAETDDGLRTMFGVPEGRPVVLYAGVSKSVDETSHLLELDQSIATGRIPPVHIVYRPHPWRSQLVPGERNFFDLKFRHVTIDPFMADFYRRITVSRQDGFELADYRITARLLKLVVGVISPLSTMLLEAVMHGLPVIMFYPDGEESTAGRIIDLGKKLPHFAEFWGVDGIQVISDPSKLSDAIALMLTKFQSPETKSTLKAHAKKYVVMSGPRYGSRLTKLANELTMVPAL
jgi:hypothetical protein